MMAWESDPTENARPFQMGMAARNGVTAAMLAGRGFGGPVAIFDHGHTIFHAFSRNASPAKLLADLGAKWDGIAELAIKPYSSVSFLHPALDALADIRRAATIAPEKVKRITLRFPRSGVHCVDNNPLKSHCAQYILPVALARNLDVADLFVDRRETDPLVAALAKRVEVVADDELDKLFPDFYASILEIETDDGTVHRRRQDVARGYPESPLGAGDLDAKFRRLVGSVAKPARIDALAAAVGALPGAASLSAYADLLRAKPNA
jgi:2-methylcitrate dehydratase PrpD